MRVHLTDQHDMVLVWLEVKKHSQALCMIAIRMKFPKARRKPFVSSLNSHYNAGSSNKGNTEPSKYVQISKIRKPYHALLSSLAKVNQPRTDLVIILTQHASFLGPQSNLQFLSKISQSSSREESHIT